MNKYQESLNFIVKNSCHSHKPCKECHINEICNNLVKPHLNRLQELIDKYERLEKSDESKEQYTIEQHQEIHELRDKVRQLEKALDLYIDWTTDCDFGYDNIPELYEKYKDEIENMGYTKGIKYILKKEVKE